MRAAADRLGLLHPLDERLFVFVGVARGHCEPRRAVDYVLDYGAVWTEGLDGGYRLAWRDGRLRGVVRESPLLLDAARGKRGRSPWLEVVEARLRERGRVSWSHNLLQEAVVAGLLGCGLVLEGVSRLA